MLLTFDLKLKSKSQITGNRDSHFRKKKKSLLRTASSIPFVTTCTWEMKQFVSVVVFSDPTATSLDLFANKPRMTSVSKVRANLSEQWVGSGNDGGFL